MYDKNKKIVLFDGTNTDSWKMREYISSSCMLMVSHWITMLSRFWISRISSRYVLRL